MSTFLLVVGLFLWVRYIGFSDEESEAGDASDGHHWDAVSGDIDPVRLPGKIYSND